MNSPKSLDQLIENTQKLPLPMTIAQVDQLIGQFPPTTTSPTVRKWRPRWLFFAVVAVAASLLWINQGGSSGAPDPMPRMAAAFPLEANAEELVTPPAEETVVVETIDNRRPRVRKVITLKPTAKATSVRSQTITTLVPDLALVPNPTPAPTPPGNEVTAAADRPDFDVYTGPVRRAFGDVTIAGDWRLMEKTKDVMLTRKEKINGRKLMWMLMVNLSPAELERVQQADGGVSLERTAGRLLLEIDEEGKGRFTFQPNLVVRKFYETSGWGTGAVVEEDIHMFGTMRGLRMGASVYTREPVELTWMRYFLNHVGDDYINALADLRLERVALQELWRLPNDGVTLAELQQIYRLIAEVLEPQHTPLDMKTLLWLAKERGMLEALGKAGYRDVPTESLRTLADAEVTRYYLTRVNNYRENLLPLDDVVRLHAAGLDDYAAERYNRYLSSEPTVAELLKLHEVKVTGYELRRYQEAGLKWITPEDVILAQKNGLTPAKIQRLKADGREHDSITDYLDEMKRTAEATTDLPLNRDFTEAFGVSRSKWKSGKKKLPAFKTLRVEDEIQVLIVPGDEFAATFTKMDYRAMKIDFEVSPGGELRIRKRMRFGWQIKAPVVAEVRLTVPRIEGLSVGESARVWMAAGLPLLPGAGRAELAE